MSVWSQSCERYLKSPIIVATVILFLSCNTQQDRRDAEEKASRIHAQLQRGDFLSIYGESSSGFKQVGNESTFITGMQRFLKENGSLKTATEVAYLASFDSNAGRTHTLIFDLEFERGRAKERMIFVRSSNGQMELWDLSVDPIQ